MRTILGIQLLPLLLLVGNGAGDVETMEKSVPDTTEPLFLTRYMDSGQLELARNLARVGALPDAPDPVSSRLSYSGFITVDSKLESHLHFWFFPAVNQPESAPVLLWLEGGPGASGFLSVFNQNGPFIVAGGGAAADKLKLEARGSDAADKLRLEARGSDADWTRNYSLVYVDSPIGTGFSFTRAQDAKAYPTTSEENAVHLVSFIRQFQKLFPQFSDPGSTPWHLIGESYGGHFAPALATALHRDAPEIQVASMVLLIPWVNPRLQSRYYGRFLYEIGLIPGGDTLAHFKMEEQRMVDLIDAGDTNKAMDTWMALTPGPNSYFMNISGFKAAWDILHDTRDPAIFGYTEYVNRLEFKRAMHVGDGAQFNSLSDEIWKSMYGEFMVNKAGHVEDALERGMQVTVIAGQLDITVPHLSVEEMVNALQWEGADEFKQASRSIWRTSDGQVGGWSRKAMNLEYVLMRNTGHVPIMIQPQLGLELIHKIIQRSTSQMQSATSGASAKKNEL